MLYRLQISGKIFAVWRLWSDPVQVNRFEPRLQCTSWPSQKDRKNTDQRMGVLATHPRYNRVGLWVRWLDVLQRPARSG